MNVAIQRFILHPSAFILMPNLLDTLQTKFPDSSRTTLRQMLQAGRVRVNGEVEKDAKRDVGADDAVDVVSKSVARQLPPGLTILHEDVDVIVVLKSQGLLTVATERERDTTAQAYLKDQFKRREPERCYLTVVYGRPEPDAGTWRDFLVWDEKALIQKETHPRDPRGTEAITTYRVLERFSGASLLEVRLQTGRRNQVRIQARLRGHTLVGEQRYVFGPGELRPIPFPRHALHAWRLVFRHPDDDRRIELEAAPPADFSELLSRLRRKG